MLPLQPVDGPQVVGEQDSDADFVHCREALSMVRHFVDQLELSINSAQAANQRRHQQLMSEQEEIRKHIDTERGETCERCCRTSYCDPSLRVRRAFFSPSYRVSLSSLTLCVFLWMIVVCAEETMSKPPVDELNADIHALQQQMMMIQDRVSRAMSQSTPQVHPALATDMEPIPEAVSHTGSHMDAEVMSQTFPAPSQHARHHPQGNGFGPQDHYRQQQQQQRPQQRPWSHDPRIGSMQAQPQFQGHQGLGVRCPQCVRPVLRLPCRLLWSVFQLHHIMRAQRFLPSTRGTTSRTWSHQRI